MPWKDLYGKSKIFFLLYILAEPVILNKLMYIKAIRGGDSFK